MTLPIKIGAESGDGRNSLCKDEPPLDELNKPAGLASEPIKKEPCE